MDVLIVSGCCSCFYFIFLFNIKKMFLFSKYILFGWLLGKAKSGLEYCGKGEVEKNLCGGKMSLCISQLVYSLVPLPFASFCPMQILSLFLSFFYNNNLNLSSIFSSLIYSTLIFSNKLISFKTFYQPIFQII